nr:hypothetical protein [Tanacetum cinerariifolium]
MLDSDFIPSDNSLPEFKIFYFDIEEKNSGSTTIHVDISLPDLECFNFDFEPDQSELTSIVDSGICENILSATNVNLPPEEDHSPPFAYVVWIFLSFLTYPVVRLNLFLSEMKIPCLTPASQTIISLLYCRMYHIDIKSDPRVPLILGRHFLRTAHALIDVHGEEMILRDEFETFYFDIEEKNSGSTTIHADISLPDLECFIFDFKPDPGELKSIVGSQIRKNVPSTTNVNLPPEEDHFPLFAYVVWIFLSFLTYLVVPPHLLSFENEDTIFELGIANYHFSSLLLDVSHR